MTNPYLIQGPAQISFSGGRSSGMMLCKIVEAHGGTLPDDVVVLFANTGKEREETLVFVQQLADHLFVNVRWLEYRSRSGEHQFAIVDFDTASRNGEPFASAIQHRTYLPNPVARFCTVELKVRTMHRYLRSIGWTEWDSVVGIRADEPRRLAKLANQDYGKHEERLAPMGRDGATKADVRAFWDAMPFDLGLPTINGETVGGNCDLCYLKGAQKVIGLIRENPSAADWWATQEATGKRFRIDRPDYASMKIIAMRPGLFDTPEEEALPCECTD